MISGNLNLQTLSRESQPRQLDQAADNPYYPMLTARDRGIIDPDLQAKPLVVDTSISIRGGWLPNYKAAGLVRCGFFGEPIGAFDLVGVEETRSESIIYPISKKAVGSDGRFRSDGEISFTTADGRWLWLAAEVCRLSDNDDANLDWKINAYSMKRNFGRVAIDGSQELGIFVKNPMDELRRVVEVDAESGIVVAVKI